MSGVCGSIVAGVIACLASTSNQSGLPARVAGDIIEIGDGWPRKENTLTLKNAGKAVRVARREAYTHTSRVCAGLTVPGGVAARPSAAEWRRASPNADGDGRTSVNPLAIGIFGAGADLLIASNCNVNKKSYNNLPHSYGGDHLISCLWKDYHFSVIDYEVFIPSYPAPKSNY
ncbi:hypothetical protein G5I_03283 [Acromyrmex echinatior]|uniref:Uncharacterized protein n=1 Tax=Acromyrmex echinatior TaxID=103372 RepID=F4WCK7_ACREC|nr:hypothetical protein G5I_03283 [Acromyrmex echinatior]